MNAKHEGFRMPVVKRVNILPVAKTGALFGIVMAGVGIFYGLIAASMTGRFISMVRRN